MTQKGANLIIFYVNTKMIKFAPFHTNKAEEGYFKATQAVNTVIEFRGNWFYLKKTMYLFLN